jgi:putative ABC transport system substrate-binding protein
VRRRVLLAVTAAALPAGTSQAQRPGQLPRIGYLSFQSASANKPVDEAFRAGLRDRGYVEGGNIHIESRYADGDEDRLAVLAAGLVAQNVDVIVTYAQGVPIARKATSTIPIVQATGFDPVVLGIAASLARPGGNVTGLTFFAAELMAKRLELLKEADPTIARVGVLLAQNQTSTVAVLEAMTGAAKGLSVQLDPREVAAPAAFERSFSIWSDAKIQGVVISDNGLFQGNVKAIAALAEKHRLRSIGTLELAAAGGLMAYGVDFPGQFRRAAVFVDKILKGAKPGDMPIEQATKFELVVNLKTARALGLTVPPSILARADEVIE